MNTTRGRRLSESVTPKRGTPNRTARNEDQGPPQGTPELINLDITAEDKSRKFYPNPRHLTLFCRPKPRYPLPNSQQTE